MGHDTRLVDKGADAPFQGLLDQARYHVKIGKKYASELAEHTWSKAQTDELDGLITSLDTEQARKLDERAGARQTTRDEGAAVSDAKSLIARFRNVSRQVVRKNPSGGVTLDDFEAGTKLGRSASKISSYLGKVRPYAAKLDDAFAPFFKGEPLTKLIDTTKAKLDDAGSTQAVDHATLPDDTAAVLELKGRILEAIEDMNGPLALPPPAPACFIGPASARNSIRCAGDLPKTPYRALRQSLDRAQ